MLFNSCRNAEIAKQISILNQMKSDAPDLPFEYEYTEDELKTARRATPQRLVISDEFNVKCLGNLNRRQMEIMLTNYYNARSLDFPPLKTMNETVLRSRIHLAVWSTKSRPPTMPTSSRFEVCPPSAKKPKVAPEPIDVDVPIITQTQPELPIDDSSLPSSPPNFDMSSPPSTPTRES